MADNDKTKDPGGYPVGYGKPPKRTRFKKGQSGNPKGRPKGSLNSAAVFDRAARERIVINENGQRKIVTKQEAVYKQLVNKAVSGDLGALRLFLMLSQLVEQQQEGAAPMARLDDADQKVILGMLKRFESSPKGEPDK